MYPHLRNLDRCYITGTGSVQIFASNEAVNPFKKHKRGGDAKPEPADYIQDGLITMFPLDGSYSDVLTDPVYVTDSDIGREVGDIINGRSSFQVNRSGWDCAGADGITLQCLVKFDTLTINADIIAVGYNHIYPVNAAFGLGTTNGKLAIHVVNGSHASDYTLSDGVWYHLALVYNDVTHKLELYANGVQLYTRDFSGSMSTYAAGSAIGTWVWSSQYPNPSSTNHGDFRIANCCFYAKALKNSEIAENFEVDKKRYGIQEV